MANIIASQSLAAAATVTSSSVSWTNNDVIICSCIIGNTPPNQQCQVQLYGSIDNANFILLATQTFGVEPGQTYYRVFNLNQFIGPGPWGCQNSEWLENLNSGSAAVPSNLKIKFGGNDTAAVTVAAVH